MLLCTTLPSAWGWQSGALPPTSPSASARSSTTSRATTTQARASSSATSLAPTSSPTTSLSTCQTSRSASTGRTRPWSSPTTSSRTTTLTKPAALCCCTSAPGTRSGFRCTGTGTKMGSMLTTLTIPLSWASSCTLTQKTTKAGGAAWKRRGWLSPGHGLGHWRYSYNVFTRKLPFARAAIAKGRPFLLWNQWDRTRLPWNQEFTPTSALAFLWKPQPKVKYHSCHVMRK